MTVALFVNEPARSGFLVTVDGPNGSGKTSVVQATAAALRADGEAVHTTRQPSPTPLGDYIRSAELEMRGRALACLIAADRHHQARSEIVPTLGGGPIVLCDRYVESSLVLQQLDGVDIEFILAINAGVPRPDLRIRLLAAADVLRARIANRPNHPERRFERTTDPERELSLYAAADELLETQYRLPATVYDTSSTQASDLGTAVARLILDSWKEKRR